MGYYTLANLHFILGGARSGKSSLAENIALATQQPVIYIATAQAKDHEMSSRIKIHQQQRPSNWQVIESPLNLAQVIEEHAQPNICLLVDCLTLWLTNCLCEHGVEYWLAEKAKFLKILENVHGNIILVSNEVGHGIVPLGQLSRDFVDYSGWLHQAIAAQAQQVDFVIAGLPLTMKSTAEISDQNTNKTKKACYGQHDV